MKRGNSGKRIIFIKNLYKKDYIHDGLLIGYFYEQIAGILSTPFSILTFVGATRFLVLVFFAWPEKK